MIPDPLEGFTPVTDWAVNVEDRWPAGRLRDTAIQAYDMLARQGEILPDGVHRYRSGVTIVLYRARIPEAWVHELLARKEREIIGG